ncbi:MAG TPA: hypothetical protein VFV93_18035 [Thermomicrobiales bacterium]|nr:hypothetical protein [Thermomicrobiales bacterium]
MKAYEARRSAEVNREQAVVASEATAARPAAAARTAPPNRRVYALSRAEEYAIIRSDLRRLLWILAVLTATLLVLTFFLR